MGDIRSMYKGIKKASGPNSRKTAPLYRTLKEMSFLTRPNKWKGGWNTGVTRETKIK